MPDISFKKSLLYFRVILIALELLLHKDFILGNYYFFIQRPWRKHLHRWFSRIVFKSGGA
jgi:hypothetical protein